VVIFQELEGVGRRLITMTQRTDDATLVRLCRTGRPEVFGELVERHQDRLHAALTRFLGDTEEARDLLQDAFLNAYRKLDQFQGESSFSTWVYRIAMNLALSRRRKRKRLFGWWDREGSAPPDPSDLSATSDPTANLERAELEALVQRALSQLPPEARAVIILRDLEGLSYEEIAEILGVPIGTVRSRLHRARGELRLRLQAPLERMGWLSKSDDATRIETTLASSNLEGGESTSSDPSTRSPDLHLHAESVAPLGSSAAARVVRESR